MENILSKFVIFAVGAAAGSVVTWKIVKTRYELIAQEEIESVKAAFSKISKDESDDESEGYTETVTKPSKTKLSDYADYCDVVADSGYTNGEKGGTELMEGINPFVIPPEDYGEKEDYETVTLTYYADDVLALEYADRDTGEIKYDVIDDVDHTIGVDSLTHFGEYEDDSVHVRNDRLECDYEILRDYRKFSDIISYEGD